jgi:hypothetical protein
MMKSRMLVFFVLATLSITYVSVTAQVSLNGRWTGKEGSGRDAWPVVIELSVKGKTLSGKRVVTLPNRQQECDIEDGKVDGRIFSFKCSLVAPDGGNPFTAEFEGFLNSKGTEITVSPQKPASGGPVTLSRG